MDITILEFAGVVLGAAGLFASVLGALLTYVARYNGDATRALAREIVTRMDQRADERHREIASLRDRMDSRANDLHAETLQTIAALRAAR